MNITREVILDLLPVYLAGEASPATRVLVEEFLKQDPDLAQRIRLQVTEGLARAVPSELPPELELRTLNRTRKLLGWQRWLFGFGMWFTAMALALRISFDGGHLTEFRLLILDNPLPFGACLVVGLACWIAYFSIRRGLRMNPR